MAHRARGWNSDMFVEKKSDKDAKILVFRPHSTPALRAPSPRERVFRIEIKVR